MNKDKPTFEDDQNESIIHLDKKMEDAIKDSKSEMTLEEQQAILNQIIRDVRRSQLSKKKVGKMLSPNHKKDKRAKKRMQKKSRKLNRK